MSIPSNRRAEDPTTIDRVRDRTWEDIGFAEFPVVTTALKRPPFNTLEFTDKIGVGKDGRPIYRTWQIVGSEEYGLPRLGDLDIFIAILKLLERHNYEKKLVPCTAKDICEIAGIARGGQTYQRIREAFLRFQTTSYVAKNYFTDPATGDRVLSEGWDIITDHRIVADSSAGQSLDGLPPSYFAVSNTFLARLRGGKLKPLDLALWRELPLGLEKPLFHYLDKNLYRKSAHEVGLRKLSQRIGLTGTYDLAQLKRRLTKPLSTLTDKHFLREFRFERSKMPADPWKLVALPGPRARGTVRGGIEQRDAARRAPESRISRNSAIVGRSAHRRVAAFTHRTGLSAEYDAPRVPAVATRDHDPSARLAYRAWCREETERRYDALEVEERAQKVADAMAELQRGRHAEIFLIWPESFRRMMAENKVRRTLARDLPSFEEWKSIGAVA